MMGYGRGPGYGYGYNNMMGGGFGGLIFLLFGALVLVAIVLLVLWAVRASGGHSVASHHGPGPGGPGATMHPAEAAHHEAVAIAKKRLASGEITPQQYEDIINALNK
jgi:uncharacterized membrane protein